MKAFRTIICGSLAVFAAGLLCGSVSSAARMPHVFEIGYRFATFQLLKIPELDKRWVLMPMNALEHHRAPVIAIAQTRNASVAVVIETPVLTVEERGDAMIFEISALAGMPFDQSILTPFQ